MSEGWTLKLSTTRTQWWWPFSQTPSEVTGIYANSPKMQLFGEAPAIVFLVDFGHNTLQTCSTLHKESNAIKIVSIGVRTKLVKIWATKSSAVSFSKLFLRFPESQDVLKAGWWVLGVLRHL